MPPAPGSILSGGTDNSANQSIMPVDNRPKPVWIHLLGRLSTGMIALPTGTVAPSD
ncbi:hypothetical protein CLV40_12143 [Actinokineospora auranticolor]|uniref:Uncharacterized protein n=1 Tax=Actinokineospora auranticolor TaxID=155976 RepID=A0A2S6GG23_9PSEU|nr:hypothetical protein CLV40_12143 [Actinokineospora auranticolor]